MKFDAIQQTLASLHMSDDTLLKRTNFAVLAKNFTTYPATIEGKKHCILLPHGMTPKQASRLAEDAPLARRIIVLKQVESKWARVWPAEGAAAPQATPTAAAAESVAIEGEIVEE